MGRNLLSPVFATIRHLRNKLLLGILVLVPLIATVLILVWAFNSIDNILQPIIRSTWGIRFPGIGFAIVIVLAYIAGIIASSILGRRIISGIESLLDRLPLFGQLYRGIRQIIQSFSEPRQTGFMQVVFVEYPRKGIHSIGFITNELRDESEEKIYTVFIPTSPNPTSGFMEIVREKELIKTNISVDEAIRVVVSAGRVPLQTSGLVNEKEKGDNKESSGK